MKTTQRFAVASLSLLASTCAGTALGGPSQKNAGTFAYLAWSPTDTTATDNGGTYAAANVYVIYRRPAGLSFRGGEIDLTWTPAGDGAGCFDHVGVNYRSSSGTLCTYLNRGNEVPVVVNDDPDHFHVAWASNEASTGCTLGAGIQVAFETDLCSNPTPEGAFTLNFAHLLDDVSNANDSRDPLLGGYGGVTISQPRVTMNPTPVRPTTWGAIKRHFGR